MKLTDPHVRATMVRAADGDPVGVILLIRLADCKAVRCEGDDITQLTRRLAEVSAERSAGTEIREVVYGLPPRFDPVWVKRPHRRHPQGKVDP